MLELTAVVTQNLPCTGTKELMPDILGVNEILDKLAMENGMEVVDQCVERRWCCKRDATIWSGR